jgi:hypothetical protein
MGLLPKATDMNAILMLILRPEPRLIGVEREIYLSRA